MPNVINLNGDPTDLILSLRMERFQAQTPAQILGESIMKCENNQLQFSATDLTNFLGCKHAAELDRELAHGRIQSEFRSDPTLDLLIELGNRHEKNYLDYLRAQGGVVVEIPKFEDTMVHSLRRLCEMA